MDLSRDEEGATQDRSNAPITTTNDPEQVIIDQIDFLSASDNNCMNTTIFSRSARQSAVASSRGK